MIIRKNAYPRAGLIGNPSDGYFGKTIALAFTNFRAEVVLYESPDVEILPNTRDHSAFRSLQGLVEDVSLFGYYGGVRLLKATVKRFYDYCREQGIALHSRNFTLRYQSDIPHMVGLAGSSAIITACLRALMAFYGVKIIKPAQANLILSVERDELGISAGLQDRVAQVYQGVVYMDFDRALMESRGFGLYEELDPTLLPPLFIAYRLDMSEGSEIYHNDLRERLLRGEDDVVAAIRGWAGLTDEVRSALQEGRPADIGPLLDANFDRRAELYRIAEGNLRMVQETRAVGCSAKFTGSGGAIIGTYENEKMYLALKRRLEPLNIRVIKPAIASAAGEN